MIKIGIRAVMMTFHLLQYLGSPPPKTMKRKGKEEKNTQQTQLRQHVRLMEIKSWLGTDTDMFLS